jgi:hypothetical protein
MPGRPAEVTVRALAWFAAGLFAGGAATAQVLPLPARPADAPPGSTLVRLVADLPLAQREERLAAEFLRGNVPSFLRRLQPVTLRHHGHVAVLHVTPDYVAVGSEDDYFLAPLTPGTAARLAAATGCVLPTTRIVDAIHAGAPARLEPAPLPPGPAMTTVGEFARHNAIVRTQRVARLAAAPWGTLTAGHKKDVVQTPRLASAPGRVAIYGWHRTNGTAIQPLYLGHTNTWVDYSHGIRLVRASLLLDGQSNTVAAVLADPALASLLSDESGMPGPPPSAGRFGETRTEWRPLPDVRVVVNEPAGAPSGRPVQLVLYALPNGNTVEWTEGRRRGPGDDWHVELQHIAAQMRWVRAADTNQFWVVAYLETAEKSWPAWRRRHADASTRIRGLVEGLAGRFSNGPVRLTLTGHSGGGSFTFGYLDAVESVPARVERMAFLDSNYAYDPGRHDAKLQRWLAEAGRSQLVVLAYDDARALLNGRSFVSEAGGTWGRSQLLRTNLAAAVTFARTDAGGMQRWRGLGGRVQLWLKENPERAVLHTVQVERNGFIHALFTGTPLEERGYDYFGARVYETWIE